MEPSVPIPKRFPRSSVTCLIVIAFLTALWLLSDRRVYSIGYNWQQMLPPVATPLSTEYSLEISDIGVRSNSGVIVLSRSAYTSYDSNRDDLVIRWREHHGWHGMGFGDTVVLPRRNPFANEFKNVDGGFQLFGLGVITSSRQGEKAVAFTIPILYLILLASLPVMLALQRRRRYFQRLRAGHCVRCGYSLGGVGTCPECGTARS